jgi:hypothetical protein
LLLGLFLSSISFLERVDLCGSILAGASIALARVVIFLDVLTDVGSFAG